MHPQEAAAFAVASAPARAATSRRARQRTSPGITFALMLASSPAFAQVSTPANPQVGTPTVQTGPSRTTVTPPRGDLPNLIPRSGPLPANLTLEQAIEEAEARSPAITAAQAGVTANQARLMQAGFRPNPELSVQLENFLGTGDVSGFQGTELTVSVNQRLDLGGRRSSRRAAAEAAIAVSQLRLAIARADLGRSVRGQFATALAARDRLRLTIENEARARELARIAGILVDAGREPPLRALRARTAATQATTERRVAEFEEAASRRTLASFFGVDTPPAALAGSLALTPAATVPPAQTLEVRLAEAELVLAQAGLSQEIAARRLDPAVGLGIRRLQATQDQAFVAGFSMPLPFRNRNQGNIAAAQANIQAAEAQRAGALAFASVRINNAQANLQASEARLRAVEQAAIPDASEALRLAQLSYQAGKIELIELLDAQNALTAVQNEAVQARAAQAQAVAELVRATAQ